MARERVGRDDGGGDRLLDQHPASAGVERLDRVGDVPGGVGRDDDEVCVSEGGRAGRVVEESRARSVGDLAVAARADGPHGDVGTQGGENAGVPLADRAGPAHDDDRGSLLPQPVHSMHHLMPPRDRWTATRGAITQPYAGERGSWRSVGPGVARGTDPGETGADQ
ncbi:hypothetical protein GCM10027053_45210 [Intrasporangium mesophilum]